MNIFGRAVSGTAWNALSIWGQQAANFVIFIYMARLLSPASFGLIALSLVIVELGCIFSRLGLVEAAIQKTEMSDSEYSGLFLVLLFSGIFTSLAIFTLAPMISRTFGRPELTPIIIYLSPICSLQNLTAVPEAKLEKAFGFKSLTIRTLAGVSVGGIFGVVLAILGFGLYSLVVQRIVTVCTQIFILWLSIKWLPTSTNKRAILSTFLLVPTGINIMLGNLVNTLNTKTMDLIVGIFMGPSALGLLRIAWKCFEIIIYCTIYPISNVALVTFSTLRESPKALFSAYNRMTQTGSLLVSPILLGLSAIAELFVPLVLGPKWIASVPLVRILGFMAIASSTGPFFFPLMAATGHSRLLLGQVVFQGFLSILFTVILTPFGIDAVVWGQVLRSAVVTLASLAILRYATGLTLSATLHATLPAMVSSLIMWGFVRGFIKFVPLASNYSTVVVLGISIMLGAAVYITSLFCLFKDQLRPLILEAWQKMKALKVGS
jgi:O-antigen/teichoic acid export membrane protein